MLRVTSYMLFPPMQTISPRRLLLVYRPMKRPVWPRPAGIRRLRDLGARGVVWLAAGLVIALLLLMAVLLAQRAWPLLRAHSLRTLLGGQVWQPLQGLFGFAPFIAGSLAVTLAAMGVAGAPAVLGGIYLAEYTSQRTRTWLKPVLDLLVGIPSVVYGLWGILVVVPLMRDVVGPWCDHTLGQALPFFRLHNASGYGLGSAGLVLGIMVFPLVMAVTEEVMRSIPQEMRAALLCLGATRWETTRCLVRHRGLPGIIAALVLGFSRAYGETLAVMMLIGNTVQMPRGLFDAAYSLPALIANHYGEMMSTPLYDSALMTAALLLLLVTLLFNGAARAVIIRLNRRNAP